MARKRNPTVVTCRVGARMRPRAPRVSRNTPRERVRADDGPFAGWILSLTTDRCTLEMVVRGQVGRYAGSKWVPSLVHA
jgi:hypothetical protein